MSEHAPHDGSLDSLLNARGGDFNPPAMGTGLVSALRRRRRTVIATRVGVGLVTATAIALGAAVGVGAFSPLPKQTAPEQIARDNPGAPTLPSAKVSPAPAHTVASYLPVTTSRRGDMPLPEDTGTSGGMNSESLRPNQANEFLRGL